MPGARGLFECLRKQQYVELSPSQRAYSAAVDWSEVLEWVGPGFYPALVPANHS
jgi:hypothetical protein